MVYSRFIAWTNGCSDRCRDECPGYALYFWGSVAAGEVGSAEAVSFIRAGKRLCEEGCWESDLTLLCLSLFFRCFSNDFCISGESG
jgi:hypothetical protein